MPKESEEGGDEEEDYWRQQQAGMDDDSDDEEYSPEVRPAHLLHPELALFCPQKICLMNVAQAPCTIPKRCTGSLNLVNLGSADVTELSMIHPRTPTLNPRAIESSCSSESSIAHLIDMGCHSGGGGHQGDAAEADRRTPGRCWTSG